MQRLTGWSSNWDVPCSNVSIPWWSNTEIRLPQYTLFGSALEGRSGTSFSLSHHWSQWICTNITGRLVISGLNPNGFWISWANKHSVYLYKTSFCFVLFLWKFLQSTVCSKQLPSWICFLLLSFSLFFLLFRSCLYWFASFGCYYCIIVLVPLAICLGYFIEK